MLLPIYGCGQLWDIAYNLHYHTCHSMPCLTPQTLYPLDFELQQGGNAVTNSSGTKMQLERWRDKMGRINTSEVKMR
ncbi:hypothetical protein B9P84_02160 [Citrobacter braakii]|uniref:Uncharacterized protein n=1 Tax=Citrobacter braakii TaxID=57706 RepID=A0AA44RHL5_CITBR|nr:hypothetical protein BWD41_11360 [Citrobacter braakii]OXU13547.1 hypothetical protein B9P84_02160 [Citrobacter braakii]PLC63934.1 hypothetical protein B9P82_11610 [Citrobacter sp. L55]PPS51713.1 hypothetical protein BWR12_07350 [Citrobacter braakii]